MMRRDAMRIGVLAALGLLGAALADPASGQGQLVLKSADVHPMGYPTVEAVK